ncbi:lipoyl synthase [Capsulimonas corticalis]|uniref:Lipoyl synthase n=1 Tax=Capsulimonas corticalis TaxID=2219043 RepID=A0A402CP34_9BACT|nr:lipoyl synthase [Capsulimonas corticalis]BDI33066.1 lipoyl synthase [Capsulimonas corticalis]
MADLIQVDLLPKGSVGLAEPPAVVNRRIPEWLTIKLPKRRDIGEVTDLMRSSKLVTVCEEARCPNLGECWSKRTATFMIMGDTCTRSCRFCAVKTGKGGALDIMEPQRLAESAAALGLKHTVVTSVNRDELPDGGSHHFAETIHWLRKLLPDTIIEVLTPDFLGNKTNIQTVVDAKPHIFNHNIETIPRLYRKVRPQARYSRSLQLLQYVKQADPEIYTKSGFMVGFGETKDEVVALMEDLKAHDVDAVTIGQYLKPGKNYLDVVEYVHPDRFAEYKEIGEQMGFLFVASGPFIRSSYNAKEFSDKFMAMRAASRDAA